MIGFLLFVFYPNRTTCFVPCFSLVFRRHKYNSYQRRLLTLNRTLTIRTISLEWGENELRRLYLDKLSSSSTLNVSHFEKAMSPHFRQICFFPINAFVRYKFLARQPWYTYEISNKTSALKKVVSPKITVSHVNDNDVDNVYYA